MHRPRKGCPAADLWLRSNVTGLILIDCHQGLNQFSVFRNVQWRYVVKMLILQIVFGDVLAQFFKQRITVNGNRNSQINLHPRFFRRDLEAGNIKRQMAGCFVLDVTQQIGSRRILFKALTDKVQRSKAFKDVIQSIKTALTPWGASMA